jgi:hypothetical protein
MAEETEGTGAVNDEGAESDKDTGTTDTEPDHKAEAEKWKALARKHEGQAKANSQAAKRLKEIEDADKSEADKAVERAAAAEKRAIDAESRAMRLEVASAKGLTSAQAKRLVGSNQEELEADADELLASFKSDKDDSSSDKGGGTRTPKERLRSGAAPDAEPEDNDPRKLADAVPRDRF